MGDYYERATVLQTGYRKAIKDHKCKECGRKITKGESYLYEAYIFDGDFGHHKTCNHCLVVRDHILDVQGEFGYGCLYEDIDNSMYDWKDKFYADGMRRGWTKKDGTLWKIPKI